MSRRSKNVAQWRREFFWSTLVKMTASKNLSPSDLKQTPEVIRLLTFQIPNSHMSVLVRLGVSTCWSAVSFWRAKKRGTCLEADSKCEGKMRQNGALNYCEQQRMIPFKNLSGQFENENALPLSSRGTASARVTSSSQGRIASCCPPPGRPDQPLFS